MTIIANECHILVFSGKIATVEFFVFQPTIGRII